jgi:DNA-binding LacI/PurR family transcriptional regulator
MPRFKFSSKVDQVAALLREEVKRGKWDQEIPGREALASDFGVNPKTIEKALGVLEREGMLVLKGRGRKRQIVSSKTTKNVLKISLLIYEKSDRVSLYHDELIHRISELGHVATIADKSMYELGMNLKRISAYVRTINTDAWIVSSGPRDVLEWFAKQPTPIFAEFGRNENLPISSVTIDKAPAMLIALRKLIALGHKRIVMLAREDRRKPIPGEVERLFLQELEAHGIKTGVYNLPDWANNIEAYHRCLDSLFSKTPPTALFITEAPHFMTTLLYLSRRGIMVPRDVSLICHDPDLAFSWCDPMAAHFNWDIGPVAKHVLSWVEKIESGNIPVKQSFVRAQLVGDGTIGPAPK